LSVRIFWCYQIACFFLIGLFTSRTVELVRAERRTALTADVKEVIKVMQNSPTAAYLKECSFHERIMLAAIIKCVKREGVEEVRWGEVSSRSETCVYGFQ
jgi:origin recognition complex subunit 1